MGMFGKIRNLFSGGGQAESGERGDAQLAPSLPLRQIEDNLAPNGIVVSIGISGGVPARHNPTVEQLRLRLETYAYVLQPAFTSSSDFAPWAPSTRDVRPVTQILPAAHWSTPFLPSSVAVLNEIKRVLEIGVNGHERMAVALRALIRERRKAKIAHLDLLHALYGTAVLGELVSSLQRERSTFYEDLSPFVDIKALMSARMSFQWMGYARISTLKKTDIKWLVDAFGEPSVHLSFLPLWDSLRKDAVRRYCRAVNFRR